MKELPKAYCPKDFEEKIYNNWEEKKFFNPDTINNKGKAFSIVLPPPNVTGSLHLGHAAMLAIEDLMIRYKRMQGFDTLWLPGFDHAAIATQNVVEKKIFNDEGKTRHDLGREAFLNKVEDFVSQSKKTITNQTRKMGSSVDWSRETYTLDDVRSMAVRKVFKMMYDDGLVIRGNRIVNWCPRCHTTLADDEIEYKETKSKLYWLKYGPFVLATTRPETKLGDTAVAVNPKDKRYKSMIGKKYMIPGVLGEFEITVVADEAVDPEFGTGAVKVTPAHSLVDYEIAERNELPIKQIIDEDGRMMANCGKYVGMTSLEARESIVKDMKAMGLIEKIDDDYDNKISVCYRCKTVIEPLISDQWFIDVNKKITKKGNKYFSNGASLKQVAIKVVKDKEINIIPERFEKVYFHWMENLHNWCISRQIWFGHQIPVWYDKDLKQPIISDAKPTEIVLQRHGEAKTNEKGVLSSDIDNLENGLTGTGKKQIKIMAEKLKNEKFDIIYASDFSRTKETVGILNKELKLKVIFDERLREVGVGEFEGKSVGDFVHFREADFEAWRNDSPKGIESFLHQKKRVFSCLTDILKKYSGKKVLVVSHGDVLRMAQGMHKNLTDEEIFKLGYPETGENIKIKLTNVESPNGLENIYQDSDTLDTWFSSGLWTFSTLLPEDWNGKKFEGKDMKRFHPTTVMETGYDILFFWVARMILMTTYVKGEVPFENVYLHGLVRDKNGDKMSKSKPETAIDPLQAGDKYGFDAVRLSLLIGNTAGNDIRLYDEKIEGYRNFVNKLWNISRYILMTLNPEKRDSKFELNKNVSLSDRWILSKFNTLIQDVTKMLDEYNFSGAGDLLKEFTWNDLADWYLEIAKVENDKDVVLIHILKNLLKMWHPFMPFVTEAIWQNLGSEQELMVSKFPQFDKKMIDKEGVKEFEQLQVVIGKIRNMRSEYKIDPAKKIKIQIKAGERLQSQFGIIMSLARLEKIELVIEKPEKSATAIVSDVEIYLPLAELLDIDKEIERLKSEIDNSKKYVLGLEKKLGNEEFMKNAPELVVAEEQRKFNEAKEKIEKLQNQLEELE